MKKKILKYSGLGLLCLIVVIAILQGLGIIQPKEKETPAMTTVQPTTTVQQKTTEVVTTVGESTEKESFLEDFNDSDQISYNVTNGVLVEATETSDNGLVIKAKIEPSYSNKATINQNYHNVEDIVKNQGGDKYEYIDYWAVAEMKDGSEGKVISFKVSKDLIQSIVGERVFAIELGDYVDDLWVLPSLLQ